MCRDGEYPILAAYDLETGGFRWATCDTNPDMHIALAANETDVWLEIPYPQRSLRVDATSGEIIEISEGEPRDIPDAADRVRRDPPSNAEIRVRGGQDDPLVGFDETSGRELWRVDGIPVYDDIWAFDDDSVYVRLLENQDGRSTSWIVAYEIASGSERWRMDGGMSGWPWHVANGRLFAMWFDLLVIDTIDGSLVWRTTYGEPTEGFPRMFGAVANDDTVFVSFTSVVAGGD